MRRIPCQLAPRACQFKRHYSNAPSTSPPSTENSSVELKDIAILGGGITGLASAYYATKFHHNAQITLFEKSNRFGGWVRSSRHHVKGGTVVFEHGPRSLRPAVGSLSMIYSLGLKDQLLLTPKTSPAARNRYVYLDKRLVNVQQGIFGMIQDPVLRKTLLEVSQTVFHHSTSSGKDETIGQFFRRRGLVSTANNLVSAMIHGIYAGNIDELSASCVFPTLTSHEDEFGSPWNFIKQQMLKRLSSSYQPDIRDSVRSAQLQSIMNMDGLDVTHLPAMSASIYTLRGGLETLIDALVHYLEAHPRVKLITSATAQSIQAAQKKSFNSSKDTNKKVRLIVHHHGQRSSEGLPATLIDSEYDNIISTIPSPSIAELCPPIKDTFRITPAATVCVVNLFYDETALLPVQGFGYLIPKSTPKSLNPEGALGVVFDSDATPGLDTAPGTKLTVMLGGPHWKNLPKELLPSNSDAIEMAKGVLAAHLGITQNPILAQANLHVDCIPQYVVGHRTRMANARSAMLNNGHWSRVRVAGSWYNGVAVNDCITHAMITNATLRDNSYFGNEIVQTGVSVVKRQVTSSSRT